MKKFDAKELIRKYLENNATPEERSAVEQWYINDIKSNRTVPDDDDTEAAVARIRENLVQHARLSEKQKVVKPWLRIPVAASILIALGIGAYFFIRTPKSVSKKTIQTATAIVPGGNRAILTLANGKQISLTASQNGLVAVQGNATINKQADGQITYNTAAGNTTTGYNMVSTPRGGQYQVILSDGTRVLLNASSSLKYPVAFNGTERHVELTGEAYFEVAHNKGLPFRVTSGAQTVEVLGTHFNVNAYNDEPVIKTTLLEGSVRVTDNNQVVILKPGQQAVSTVSGNVSVIKNADTEQATAWKDGEFSFNETDIKAVMRQISRWYDVDIEYAGNISDDKLSGTFSKNVSAADALKLLQTAGINFKIEGRKIILK